jgi:peptide/nickel transport system substrate-binding protein
MEATWTIKSGATWHDGTPVTTADLLFAAEVAQDKDLPVLSSPGFTAVEAIQALDERTLTVRWKQPFIQADAMFGGNFALPLPRHLLERTYTDDKANLVQSPYWSREFIGTGPYRLRDWAQSSHVLLAAYDSYVLGRPKIDEVEVRFFPDPNALIANLLAGEVELIMGRSLSLDQAIQVRDQWRDGHMEITLSSWIAAYPQLYSPNPPIVGDARFRRALLHGTDRQRLVDTIQAGQSLVAHSYLSPRDPEYPEVERAVVKYDYNVAAATEILEGLGYTRGGDGMVRDAAGQTIPVELRTTGGDDLQEKTMFAVADDWKRLGIAVEPVVVPRQRAQDREYRANFPGFEQVRQPNDLAPGSLTRFHGSEAALPQNNYRGNNRTRYVNPEFDALIDRFYATIPRGERNQVLAQILGHMTERAIPLGIFYNTQATMIGNRLRNVTPGGASVTPAWNAQEWDRA